MKHTIRTLGLWTLIVTLLSSAAWTRAASPVVAALDAASADAQIIVVIPQMGDVSRKLASWFTTAGVPMTAQMQDLLGEMKREMGIEAGLNDNGAALIVMQNLAQAQEAGGTPDVLLLFSVSDYTAFVGNWGGQAEGVTELTLKDGSAGFAKRVGDFAVMGERAELVEAYEPAAAGGQIAAKLGPAGAGALDGSDVGVYLDVEKAGPQLKQMIDQAMSKALEGMAMGGAPNMAAAQQGLQMYAKAAHAVIDGSQALLLGFDVNDAGLGFRKTIRMKGGSELASYFPGGKSTAADDLARLPREPYLFAAAIDGRAINFGKLYATLGEQNNAMFQQMVGPAWEQAVALGQHFKSASFVFYSPDQMAMMSGSLMNSLTVVTADDGSAYLKLVREYMEKLNGLSVPMDPANADGPAITYNTTYRPEALNLEGVSVDQFQFQTTMPPEVMQQMGPMAGFVGAFSNYRGYLAAKGEHVIVTTSADPQMVTRALAAAEARNGIGSDGAIAEQRRNALPTNPAMEMYIDLAGVAQFANTFLGMMGQPPIEPPADLPPIASAMSVDGDTLTGRLYVPTAAVQFTVNAIMQVQATMNPQGPGQTPGGPAPY